ncbi:4-azaleucine resistance transporter AzlC [Sinobacterium caligoides]|uniref:4-azaleucine resistance transporter AzlC n=1 Tax=Sinobacterium caligoides TaxID=933926 RepID=A0A3N2DQB7_9GAMM|nr:AzlC family ABC transporter permease [Sinobacterium caligoides]ROS01809.1 4-azaleucine resistance transporter AzlC [Sinobacterium caligoides]
MLEEKMHYQPKPYCYDAILDILPLSIAVLPWGILCGSLSIEAGLSPFQAQLMSLLVFAGAAQLAGLTIMSAGGSLVSLIGSTFVISSRHVLYSAVFREEVRRLPWHRRVVIAFLLTDEMFLVTESLRKKTGFFSEKYAVASGLTFYILWNVSTFIGIAASELFPDIHEYGLEFAIAATFIAMIVPAIKSRSTLVAVVVTALASLVCHYMKVPGGLLVSSVVGMLVGYKLGAREAK